MLRFTNSEDGHVNVKVSISFKCACVGANQNSGTAKSTQMNEAPSEKTLQKVIAQSSCVIDG